MTYSAADVPEFLAATHGLDTQAFLAWSVRTFGSGLAFATSLGWEDQFLLDALARIDTAPATVHAFTLDTGRLPQETYDLLARNRDAFSLPIVTYAPESSDVEVLVRAVGPNAFYDSVEQRKACCRVRKVLPLHRALRGRTAWVTGLRSAQSPTRADLQRVEWDSANQLIKLNPLADWSLDQVRAEVLARKIPYNTLHDQGYPSIGCAPCTRAIKPGSDERAGRWWWENPAYKECGLHVDPAAPAPKFRFGGIGPS